MVKISVIPDMKNNNWKCDSEFFAQFAFYIKQHGNI